MTGSYAVNSTSNLSDTPCFHPYNRNVRHRRDTVTDGMDFQVPKYDTELTQSSMCTFQNQRLTAYLPQHYDSIHDNRNSHTHAEHPVSSITHLGMSKSAASLGYREVPEQQIDHRNALTRRDTPIPLNWASNAPYQLPQASLPEFPPSFDQDFICSSPAVTLDSVQSRLEHTDLEGHINMRQTPFVQPTYDTMLGTFGRIDNSAMTHAVDTTMEPFSTPDSDAYSSSSLDDMELSTEPSRTQRPSISRWNSSPSNLSHNHAIFRDSMWDMARNHWHSASGYQHLSAQSTERGSTHILSNRDRNIEIQERHQILHTSRSLELESRKRVGGFINYTLDDQKRLSEGVARSGGMKTKLRRDKKAKEKRKQLVRAVIDVIATLGTEVDPDAVQEKILEECQRQHDT